jgi:hypothetical protein
MAWTQCLEARLNLALVTRDGNFWYGGCKVNPLCDVAFRGMHAQYLLFHVNFSPIHNPIAIKSFQNLIRAAFVFKS